MAFAKIYSAQTLLFETRLVSVEIDLSRGLHTFSVVGLPDKGIEESKDRVSAAIKNSGFASPRCSNRKIVVSLAPADMRKEGPLFDLPMALAYLLASGDVRFGPEGKLFAGELALDGSIRPIRGALSYARLAKASGMRELYVPKENAAEAALIEGVSVFGAESLKQIAEHLSGLSPMLPARPAKHVPPAGPAASDELNLDAVAGHESAKRGLVIAIAGGHNVALFGPPGTGKTMLAKALGSILPDLEFEEMLEVIEIYSANGQPPRETPARPPVRAPHHTSSYSSIVGGGSGPRPGEITLAHRGILFLDEFPEFDSRVIEALRQPLEERRVSIARSHGAVLFPASFILVIAFNPCPCGNKDMPGKSCSCTAKDMERYRRKLSGPIVDRMDMWIEVSKVEHEKLMRKTPGSAETERAKDAISRARNAQKRRFRDLLGETLLNAHVGAGDLERTMRLERDAEETLRRGAASYGLSGRGYHRVVRLARTIADIDGSESIKTPHILEALQYRQRGLSAN